MAEALLGKDSMFYLPFAPFHRAIENMFINSRKIWNIVAMARGFGKSKMAALFAAWSALVDKRSYIVIVSYNEDKSSQILRDVDRIMMHPKMLSFFKHRKGNTDGATSKSYIANDGREITMKALGARSPGIGLSEGEARPDIYILDDLENPDQPKNPDILPAIEENINVKYYYGLSKKDRFGRHGKIVYLGTMHYAGCILETTLKKSNADVLIIPQEITPEIVEIAGRDVIGGSIWPELRSDEEVAQEREDMTRDGKFASYSAQMLQNPLIEGSFQFDAKKRKILTYQEGMEMSENADVYVCIDMAYSDKSWADYVGITVNAILPDSRWITLEANRNRFSDEQFFDELVRLKDTYSRFKFKGFWAETLQIQLVNAFLREMSIRKNKHIFMNHLNQIRGMSPTERIRSLVAFHDNGFWMICGESSLPLISDMNNWKGTKLKSGVDDVLDSASWIPHVFRKESDGSKVQQVAENEKYIEELKELGEIVPLSGNISNPEVTNIFDKLREKEKAEEAMFAGDFSNDYDF